MIRYKCDILQMLKDAGYNTTRIRKEKLIAEATLTNIRKGKLVAWGQIDTLCKLLNCNVGDLVEYIEGEMPESEQRKNNLEKRIKNLNH